MLGRGALAVALGVALPLFLCVGATLGFYLLFLLYIVFDLDFPTGVSVAVGLIPVVLSMSAWWIAARRLASR